MHPLLRHLLPDMPTVSWAERLRITLGALIGLLACGLVSRAAVGADPVLPVLVAPMGASAVLLFAVPASPLAQPWSILGGNLVAAVVGVTVQRLVPDPMVAAGLAGSIAILVMLPLRCLHPPSGAVALTAVLGGPAVWDLGYGFALWPVGANSALLLLAALLFNNLTGRTYPHRPPRPAVVHDTRDPPPAERIGFAPEDLDTALAESDELLDISRADLEALLRRTELHSLTRRARATRAVDIMSRDVVTVSPSTSLHEALNLIRRHHIKALPVTNGGGHVVGILTQTDLLDKAAWDARGPKLGMGERTRRLVARRGAPAGSVADVMTAPVRTIPPDEPIVDIVPILSALRIHHMPVTAEDGRLVGIVSQTDLVMALLADAARRPEPAA